MECKHPFPDTLYHVGGLNVHFPGTAGENVDVVICCNHRSSRGVNDLKPLGRALFRAMPLAGPLPKGKMPSWKATPSTPAVRTLTFCRISVVAILFVVPAVVQSSLRV